MLLKRLINQLLIPNVPKFERAKIIDKILPILESKEVEYFNYLNNKLIYHPYYKRFLKDFSDSVGFNISKLFSNFRIKCIV